MDIASVDRNTAAGDATQQGTLITAVAYASPAPSSGGVAALETAVAQADTTETATAQQAVASAAAGTDAGSTPQAAAFVAEKPSAPVAVAASVVAPAETTEKPVVVASLEPSATKTVAARSPELDTLIERYAHLYEVPVSLVRRVVKRESTFNPKARNGPYWGLMQIRHDTAKGMGYQGSATGLLNAETNLTYAVKYLKGAYVTARGDHDQAVRFYSRGYYYDAKKRGLLEEAGLKGGSAAKVRTAVIESGEQKAAELDRGARIVANSLPGVSNPTASPSPARMANATQASGSNSLAIAE
ncbi:lytic transglycosylase domain-containing protein [Tianweitania sp. BSSL-BM11]|uniref:Lytic transglycosylase domain-containing protein n=2 Tax=Tianweitania aestuarii TaxID=2814886 RepID=A0ABS5RVC4_9HYPH|nr:lytic transglycosylase domain-containing protein [Tianweitania aestuarii]